MTDLSQRYGSPSGPRKKLAVAVVVLVATAGLSWLAWAMLEHGRPEAQSAMESFHTEGKHAVVARFTVVRRSADIEADCLLRAFASDHTPVGDLNFVVGPGGPVASTLERTVRTERKATTVDLVGCRTDGQQGRR